MLLHRTFFMLSLLIFIINPFLNGAPHNNLEWQDSWCWMDSALQVLASMNPIVETLSKKVSGFNAQEKNDRWEYALHEVLQQIKDPKRKEKVNPRKLYNFITGGTIPAFDRFNKATGCTMDATYFLNDMLKALVDPASNGLLQEIDSQLRVKQASWVTVNDPDGWNYTIHSRYMLDYLKGWNQDINTNKTDFTWENFLKRQFPFLSIAEYFHLSLDRMSTGIFLGKWDEDPYLKVWNYIQGKFPDSLINFTTTKTVDDKEKNYHCYAILLGLTGHATALIEDDESPGTWYYYDDNAVDKRLNGMLVAKNTVDQVARFEIKYDHKYVMALFYKTETNPLSIKLEILKSKLKDLSSKLQLLKNNLSALKQNLKV